MITIISGTNRKDNFSKKVALECQRLLEEKLFESRLLSLDEVNMSVRDEDFIQTESELLKPAEKFIIISPEYVVRIRAY